jgi:FAD dependent oxidoreductase
MKITSSKTRRTFIQSAAIGTAATASAPLLSADAIGGTQARRVIKTDVLVCGGGCAGSAAALAGARSGAKTLLVEKAPFAGGIITSVGLPYFDGIAHIDTRRVVVRGIALEMLSKSGVCAPDAKTLSKHNPTIPNTFEFKLLLDRLFNEQKDNLSILFNTFVCDVHRNGDRIESVTLANKDGLVTVEPKVVIDCSGDADVAAWAGAPFEQNKEVQPLTLHFRIANVENATGTDGFASAIAKDCKAALGKAQERGELPHFYGPGVMFLFGKNDLYIHGVRVPADPTNAADLSRAELQGRADAHAMFRAWKNDVPAFKDSYFMEAYPWIGVRESRRIIGQHVLSEDDLMKSRRFDDAIATGCWYLDLHPNKTTLGGANDFDPKKHQPEPYDIPYRSLVPQKISNLLVAGRCHSATRGAHASTRVTVTAMAMGEAAGVAAAMSLRDKTEVATLDGVKVRETLSMHNAGPFTHA